MEQQEKVISACIRMSVDRKMLEEKLRKAGEENWRLKSISTSATQINGMYCFDTYFLIVEKSESRFDYHCFVLKRENQPQNDLNAMNNLIGEQNQDDYHLVQIVHGISMRPDLERLSPGTVDHILIFEKKVISMENTPGQLR